MTRLTLSLLLLTGCATLSCKPIKVEVCVLNGDGSAECALADGSEVEKASEELENYIATNSADMEKLLNACKKR